MKLRWIAVVLAALLLVAGCGSGASTPKKADGAHTMTMPDGSTMSDAQMKAMTPAAQGAPSETASMICGREIQVAVMHTFLLKTPPSSSHTWANQLFTCTYHLAGGPLRMAVKDLSTAGPGTAYFDHLKSTLKGARKIVGLQNLGFPAFQTPGGDVVFIKDHKTLWVDASGVSKSVLPKGFSRTEAAYAVAAAVVACWSE